ncbi:MAG: radical SAM protein [Nitrospina sp.]|nr:radical SAM protein [Nitrospina sp.]
MNDSPVVFKHKKRKALSAPIMINLELTDACNLKCRHCYNFWREDPMAANASLDNDHIDKVIEEIKRADVFHVVLTGGEPFANFSTLEYAMRRLTEEGISTSINSNLMLVTPEKIQKLKDAGWDHVLTSLASYDAATNDDLMNKEGTFDKIIEGIKMTVDAGIRVSVNMVIAEINKDHVYETAKFCAELGCQKMFGTRLVPSVNLEEPSETDMRLNQESARKAVDDMIRAKDEFGIGIGTLISYPLCLLGDLEKYKDFVGRGCPAQTGVRMSLNADGTAHACTHESEGYGNILEEGIKPVFKKMGKWHNGSYLFEGCADCEYIDVCGSGCSMASEAYFKTKDAKDPLWLGRENIGVPYKPEIPEAIFKAVDEGKSFIVPQRVRFRKEDGFYVINIRWANAFQIASDLAEFLIEMKDKQQTFNLDDISRCVEDPRKSLTYMVFKDGVEPMDQELKNHLVDRPKTGASVNPFELPEELAHLS